MIALDQILHILREGIGFIGILVITAGALNAVYQLVIYARYGLLNLNDVRLRFADSILLGLEFLVGADIIGSLVTPDYYNLGLVAIIVMIRSVLSYFLSRELQERELSER